MFQHRRLMRLPKQRLISVLSGHLQLQVLQRNKHLGCDSLLTIVLRRAPTYKMKLHTAHASIHMCSNSLLAICTMSVHMHLCGTCLRRMERACMSMVATPATGRIFVVQVLLYSLR